MKVDIFRLADKIRDDGIPLTADELRDSYLGKKRKYKMLLEIFQEHNDQVEKLIGKDFAAGTAERYRTAKSHLEEYIQNEYQQKGHSCYTGKPCLYHRL